MKYNVYVNLHLPYASEQEHDVFYKTLVEKDWLKITSIGNQWKAYFVNDVSYESAIEAIKDDLMSAKNESKVRLVEYKMHINHRCRRHTEHCIL